MKLATSGSRDEMLSDVVAATTLTLAPLEVPGWLRRAVGVAGEMVGLVGIILCIPIAILAIGTPIVLLVRLLLWIGGAL